jgi:hypothetical protein
MLPYVFFKRIGMYLLMTLATISVLPTTWIMTVRVKTISRCRDVANREIWLLIRIGIHE